MFKKLALPVVFVLVAWLPLFIAAFVPWPAGSGFEVTPSGSDSVSVLDDRIRELKENIRNRLQVEHYFGTSVGASDNGRHREGSARAWDATPCPTANVTGDPGTGATAYGALDDGLLCRDSATGELKLWTGAAYVNAFSAFPALMSHITAGVAVDPYDPTKFAIRNVVQDVTISVANCGTLSATAIASQAFGAAGLACFSTGAVDLSARSTTSRALIVGQITVLNSGSCTAQFAAYEDSMANQVTLLSKPAAVVSGTTGNVVAYVTGITAASHEFALHAQRTAGTCVTTTDPNAGNLIYIDLGPEY